MICKTEINWGALKPSVLESRGDEKRTGNPDIKMQYGILARPSGLSLQKPSLHFF